ncbi:MAG: hypothetical protein CMF43_05810 [Legionellales bacterium]|nr:hypothetical protein [Legionellales bacterium]
MINRLLNIPFTQLIMNLLKLAFVLLLATVIFASVGTLVYFLFGSVSGYLLGGGVILYLITRHSNK